jgi:hypothetical protein
VTTGGAIAIVGVGALGVGGLFLLRQRAAAAGAGQSAPPTGAPPGARSSSPPALVSLANGLQALNTAGCNAVVGAKGVPAGLSSAGCGLYGKYLSPIGAARTTVALVEKIPIVGAGVKATVNGVAKVASKPISAVKNFFGGLF